MFWIKYDGIIFVFYSKNNEDVLPDCQTVNLNALNHIENGHSSTKTMRHVGRVPDEDVIEIFI